MSFPNPTCWEKNRSVTRSCPSSLGMAAITVAPPPTPGPCCQSLEEGSAWIPGQRPWVGVMVQGYLRAGSSAPGANTTRPFLLASLLGLAAAAPRAACPEGSKVVSRSGPGSLPHPPQPHRGTSLHHPSPSQAGCLTVTPPTSAMLGCLTASPLFQLCQGTSLHQRPPTPLRSTSPNALSP